MQRIFFYGWESLFHTLIVGILAYIVLVFFLRISGKRTLTKLNAFDLVVTVAFGSTLATVLLSRDVALADGALAFAILAGLQYAVTWSSVRAQWVRKLVTGEPHMLLYQGEFLPKAMKRARVTKDEVRAAVRSAGLSSLEQTEAIVLETDGSLSVVRRGSGIGRSSLERVRGPRENHVSAGSDSETAREKQ